MKREELAALIKEKKSVLCVGLDSELEKIPNHLRGEANPLLSFNKAIIDATKDFAVAYKLNVAFYESLGKDGWQLLEDTLAHLGKSHFLIADAKRGDIGNTARMYARTFFERYDFDAVTLNAYMGRDCIEPFLEYSDKWSIILGLTSNIGAEDIELETLQNGLPVYKDLIIKSSKWGNESNTMYVMGATRPDYLSDIRKEIPNHFLLVPGVGKQGGAVKDVLKNAGKNVLINNSRAILYASHDEDFSDAAYISAQNMKVEMGFYL